MSVYEIYLSQMLTLEIYLVNLKDIKIYVLGKVINM